jgi:hypothetical protein
VSPYWVAMSLRAASVGDLAATTASAVRSVILTLQIETAPFIAFSEFRRPVLMISEFFWRLGVPLAVLWYLGAVLLCITSTSEGISGRNDDLFLLLVIGPIGSAVLALLGGAFGFVFAGLSLGFSQLNLRRRLRRWRS